MPAVKDDDGDKGWDLVAARLEREISRRGLTLRAIESATGVNYRTLQKLLAGERVTRRDRLAELARYLGWEGDGFDRIRRGQEPEAAVVAMSASGANLAEIRERDPEYFAQLEELARLAIERLDAQER
jgi:transcriptional regulator with XRE-family HTH domain